MRNPGARSPRWAGIFVFILAAALVVNLTVIEMLPQHLGHSAKNFANYSWIGNIFDPFVFKSCDFETAPVQQSVQLGIEFIQPNLFDHKDYLYTLEGQHHLAANRLDPAKLAPLTQWVQEEIFRNQHPMKCEEVIVSEGWNSGFGSEIHVVGTHLAHAIETGHTLTWGPNGCMKLSAKPCPTATGSSRCTCFFREISNCTSNDGSPHVSDLAFVSLVPTRFRNALKDLIPGMTDAQILYWWRAQSAAYLTRLNDQTISEVRELRLDPAMHSFSSTSYRRYPLPTGTINAHIRGGDKYVEMKLVGADQFVTAALDLVQMNPMGYHSRTLFVSGDDLNSVLEACRLVQENGWACIYSNITRMQAGFRFNSIGNFDAEQHRTFTVHVILQLLMSLESDGWIGTRGSNWNRLIDELRCVWVEGCGGTYVEVGGEKSYPYR